MTTNEMTTHGREENTAHASGNAQTTDLVYRGMSSRARLAMRHPPTAVVLRCIVKQRRRRG